MDLLLDVAFTEPTPGLWQPTAGPIPRSPLGQLGWPQETARRAQAEIAELKHARTTAALETHLLLGRAGLTTLFQHVEERQLAQAVTRLSESAFERVWDNPDDAAYDQL